MVKLVWNMLNILNAAFLKKQPGPLDHWLLSVYLGNTAKSVSGHSMAFAIEVRVRVFIK